MHKYFQPKTDNCFFFLNYNLMHSFFNNHYYAGVQIVMPLID